MSQVSYIYLMEQIISNANNLINDFREIEGINTEIVGNVCEALGLLCVYLDEEKTKEMQNET